MKTRIIWAIIALLIFIPFIFVGGAYFAYFMWIIGIVGIREFVRMQDLDFLSPIGIISVLALSAILIPRYYLPSWLATINGQYAFILACISLMTLTVFDYREFNIENAAVMVMASLYVGYGFHFLILIRDIGIEILLYLFAVIWSTDIGAYFIGRKFGQNKLAPVISPNKTVEGMFGGAATALLVGVSYLAVIKPEIFTNSNIWFLTIAISFVGQFGDLVESAFKRHFKVKDSGRFLPGHGGMLDRFDSTIFASITLMIWFNLFR